MDLKIVTGIEDPPHELVDWTVKHFKGHVYEVIAVAKDSETLDELVIYQSTDASRQVWVRSLKAFTENVEFKGKNVPRFTKVHKKITLSKI